MNQVTGKFAAPILGDEYGVSVRKDNTKAKRPDLAQRLERRERVAYKQRKQQVREQEAGY